MFLDVATDFPGCMHDARVLQYTTLFGMARQGEILSKPSDQINNVTIKPVLLGDEAYPLSTWLMKPYAYSPNLTRAKKNLTKNFHLQEFLRKELSAFGVLDNQTENISEVIISCFALHNFCQLENEDFIAQDGILDDLFRQERVARNRRNAPRGNQNQNRRRSCTKCHKKLSHGKCLKTN